MIRDAWAELHTCRDYGMGIGPIPWTAIERYAEAEGIVERERFRFLVREMDRAYLRAESERTSERRNQREG